MTQRKYKIYWQWKKNKAANKKVSIVLKEYGISRSSLYALISQIEKGDDPKIKKCLASGRLNCLWSFKYQPRYLCLPKNRKESTIKELKELILAMKKDDFPIVKIAFLLKKERSTINHHLQ